MAERLDFAIDVEPEPGPLQQHSAVPRAHGGVLSNRPGGVDRPRGQAEELPAGLSASDATKNLQAMTPPACGGRSRSIPADKAMGGRRSSASCRGHRPLGISSALPCWRSAAAPVMQSAAPPRRGNCRVEPADGEVVLDLQQPIVPSLALPLGLANCNTEHEAQPMQLWLTWPIKKMIFEWMSWEV